MRRSRRAAVAVAVAALLAVLPGCGRLPVAGPVVSGQRIADDPGFGLLRVIAEGPTPGATPVQVVNGFLRAAGSSDDDHAVARAFLTPRAAATWRPEASTTVCARTPAVTVVDGRDAPAGVAGRPTPDTGTPIPPDVPVTVALDAPVVARIDEQGRYTPQPEGTRLAERVVLRRVGGEWRIEELPDGLVITALDASRTFRAFPLAFGTPDGSQLVPEVRWFAYGPSTATRIVRELLRGPSPWLAPALVSGAPPGTELSLGSVPVADGVASVDLTAVALTATPEQRRLLLSQLQASLLRVPGVVNLRVTVHGAVLSGPSGMPGVPPVQRPDDPRLLLVGPDGLARFDGAGVQPVEGLEAGPDAVSHPAVSPAGGPFVMLAGGGRRLLVQSPGSPPVVAVQRAEPLLPPTVDRHGWVWAAGPDDIGVVLASVPTAPATPVQAPPGGLAGELVSLRVSRDGSRALVATTGVDGGLTVAVHGVERDRTGRPVRLTSQGPLLAPDATALLDASWVGADQVVLLVSQPGEPAPRPLLVQVGGPAQPLPPVPGGVSVAADEAARGVVVGTADGRLLVRSGADWTVVAEGRHPAYPG